MSNQFLAPTPGVRVADDARELRTLRYRLKQANKQLGKAGATIFALRNALAACRVQAELPPGDYWRILEKLREVQRENVLLREKLAAKEEQA